MITPEQIAASGSEHAYQSALFQWAAINQDKYPQLKWMFAIPNGFFANPGQKAKMKAEGLRDGVPDICLPVSRPYGPVSLYCGLFIEMKREKYRNHKDGGCSENQLRWIDYLTKAGYKCDVCYSWAEARDVILEYLS